jgi:RNA polymerase sigma-70 factor (ECF subfamily)
MASPADDALLADLAAGREEAFERLYDLFGARLLRAARCICASREEAEDAVQDVVLALVRAGPALKEVRNLNAYLFTAAHRAAVRRAKAVRDKDSNRGFPLLPRGAGSIRIA